jgi:glutamate decarboxylase
MSLVQNSEAASPVPIIETDDKGQPVNTTTTSTNGYFPQSQLPSSANGTVTPSLIDNMAHLSVVRAADDSDAASIRSTSSRTSRKPQMQLASYQDEFTTSVYGSRFAGMDLPRHHMPECEMPRDIAYRMIKDDLSLDNNPMLK